MAVEWLSWVYVVHGLDMGTLRSRLAAVNSSRSAVSRPPVQTPREQGQRLISC